MGHLACLVLDRPDPLSTMRWRPPFDPTFRSFRVPPPVAPADAISTVAALCANLYPLTPHAQCPLAVPPPLRRCASCVVWPWPLARCMTHPYRLSTSSVHGAAWTDTLVALKNMEEQEGLNADGAPSSVPNTGGGASSSSFEAPPGPDGMRERKVGGLESQVMTLK